MRKLLQLMLFTALFMAGYGVNAQCNYTLLMEDSYGDGWNGNTMDVSVNGVVVLDDITLSDGSSEEIQFSVETGDEITTVWNGGGSFSYETSYEIRDSNGDIVGSGEETSISTAISAECPSCIVPENISVSNITLSSADLSWDASSTEDGGYEYVIVPSGDGVETGTPVAEATTSVTISELESNTDYDVFVRTLCGEETSAWSSAESFTTPCTVAETEYIEDFTTYLNDCWTEATGDSTAPSSFGSSSWNSEVFGNEGSDNAAYYNMYTTTTAQWLISQSINIGNAGDHQLEYDIAATAYNSTSAASFGEDDEVGVMISTDDGQTWTNLTTYNSSSIPSNSGDSEIIDLSEYTGVIQIGFYAIASSNSSSDHDLFIDNFRVRETPSCTVASNLSTENITSSSVDVSWDASESSEGGYEYVVVPSGDGVETGTPVAETSTSVSVSELDSASDYDVYVRTICGEETSEWSSAESFTTACESYTNLSENFDSSTSLPNCWEAYVSSSGSANVSDSQSSSGDNSFYIYNSYYYDAGLIIPELSNLGENYRFRFSAYSSSSSTKELEIVTVDSEGTFTTFTTVEVSASSTWEEFSIDFSDYSGTDTRIAILHGQSTSYQSFYVDDVIWEENPSCLEPGSISVENITLDSADLSWGASSTEDGGYEYVIVPSGDGVETSTPIAEASTSVSVSELSEDTDYDVFVRTLCGEEHSAWRGPETFSTPVVGATCEAAIEIESLPYTTTDDTSNYGDNYSGGPGADCGSTSSYLNGDDVVYAFTATSDNPLNIQLTPEEGETYSGIFIYENCSDIGTTCAEGVANSSSDLRELELYPTQGETYYIVVSTWASPQTVAYDLSIEEINCAPPVNLSANPSADSVELSWDISPTEQGGYLWSVYNEGDEYNVDEPIDFNSTVVGQNTVNVEGLSPNTTYDAYVATNCGTENGGFSGPSEMLRFTTPCETFTVPFSENFDSSTEGSTSNSNAPDCWSFIDSGVGYAYVYNGSSNAQSGEQAFRLYNSYNSSGDYMLISPQVTELTTDGIQISFGVGGSSGEVVEIGTITDPTDAETFTLVSSLTKTTSDYEDVTVNINSGTDNYFAIRHGQESTYNSLYIDDIEVNQLPSCLAPENPLAVVNHADSTVDLSWDASPTEDGGYEYTILPSGATPDELDFTSAISESNSASMSLDGAPSSTTFDFYVRTVCGEEVSAWSDPASFTTPPSNDDACNAIALTVGDIPEGDTYSNLGASSQEGEPDENLDDGAEATVWFTFEAPASGSVRVSTDYAGGTFDDTEIAVYSVGSCDDFETYTQLGFDQDGGDIVNFNSILEVYDLAEGETYAIQVDRWGAEAEGTFGISVEDIGYVYENSTWTPEDPSGVASDYSRIIIKNGTGVITAETDAYDVIVEPEAVLSLQADLTSDVKFMSNATSTAQLADATGFSINGDVTVERYFPANRSFRFATSAVDSDASIYDNWQEGGETPSGYGTHITGSTDGSNGFDATETGSLSLFDYDNASQTWLDVTNTDVDDLEAGKPYRLYVRGDRTIDLTDNEAQGETVLRATGDLVIGDVVADGLGETANDFSFIGNPYQATVDASSITFDNVEPGFYWVWDPNMNADGSYVVVDLSDGSNAGTSQANQFLQPGQAAFVRTIADGAASVTFSEASKNVDEVSNAVFSDDNEPRLDLRLFESQTMQDGGMEFDALGIRFKSNGNNAVDSQDAPKMGNPAENIARLNGDDFLTIENRELPQDGEVLSIATYNYEYTDYVFEADLSDFAENVTVYLNDNYTGEQTVLENGLNHVDFSVDSSIPESVSMTRFTFSFEVTTLGVSDEFASAFSVYPNPVTNQEFTIQTSHLAGQDIDLKLFNISGQAVMTQNLKVNSDGALNVETSQLSSGVYILELTQGKQSYKEKLIIK